MISVNDFQKEMNKKGWCLFPNFVPQEILPRMALDLECAYANCRAMQIKNGLDNTEGTAHHLIGQGQSFLDYLCVFEELNAYTESYFGGKYILNAFGGNILSQGMSYADNIHRDIRSFSGGLPLMLNTIVMLDDFHQDNGATWLMHGGHEWPDKPSEEQFKDYAFQITGQAGDVVFFNSNMWHRAGKNKTDKPRRSLTPMFSRPFYKQQFDYTQFADDYDSPWLKQVLGYNSRTPKALEEWYQSKDSRMYKDDQG